MVTGQRRARRGEPSSRSATRARPASVRDAIPWMNTGPMTNLANPLNLHGTPVQMRRPPPVLGQHSEEVLREHGFSGSEIDALLSKGVVKGTRMDDVARDLVATAVAG